MKSLTGESVKRRGVISAAIFGLCTMAFVRIALADVSMGPTTVTKYYAYTDFGGGDIAFMVSGAMPPGCANGFWLPATAAGFKSEYAALMVAYATGLPVVVYADPTTLWPGSGGNGVG